MFKLKSFLILLILIIKVLLHDDKETLDSKWWLESKVNKYENK